MNQKIGALFALLAGVAAPSAAAAADAIEINGRQLTPQEATLLMQTLGAQIPAGRYWYDTRSGLWGRWGDGYAGIEGGPVQINLLRVNGGGQGGRQATTFYSQGLSTTNGYYDPNSGESMVTVRDPSGKTITWSN
jgi:hypothetical protein